MTLTKDSLRPNQLIASGRTLYKVSTLHADWFTAQQVLPIPPRTTVRPISYDRLMAFKVPGNKMVADYEAAWGLAPQ